MGEFVHKKKSKARLISERVANRATRLICARFGEAWPMYYVSEYPRSGGTWLGNMLSDYLRCAKPGPSVFPIGCRAVIHNHWKYHPGLKRVIYLMRDGRDVLTSYYFFRLRAYKKPGTAGHEGNKQIFHKMLGPNFDPEDTARNLPRIMEHEFEHPQGAGRFNWAGHISMWRPGRDLPNIYYARYERMLEDCVSEVTACVRHLTGDEPDERLVRRSVDHYTMESLTGRKPGEEDPNSFVRKGISGDWLNHFTKNAAEVFDRYAGEALVLGGFEPDRDWIARYDLADA